MEIKFSFEITGLRLQPGNYTIAKRYYTAATTARDTHECVIDGTACTAVQITETEASAIHSEILSIIKSKNVGCSNDREHYITGINFMIDGAVIATRKIMLAAHSPLINYFLAVNLSKERNTYYHNNVAYAI